jgi:hypothetical protein
MNNPIPETRGARPDAETAGEIILVKNVGCLRATYQVRLLALRAAAEGRRLVLRVPARCRFDGALLGLSAALPRVIGREDLP